MELQSVGWQDATGLAPGARCSDCEQMIKAIAEELRINDISEQGERVRRLGARPDDPSQLACPVCRLLWKVATRYQKKYKCHVRLFDGVKTPSGCSQPIMSAFLAVLRDNAQARPSAKEVGQMGVLYLLPGDPAEQTLPDLITNGVDYDAVRSYMQFCSKEHIKCQDKMRFAAQRKANLTIYLIDCENLSIVETTGSESYFALSYVWGNPSSARPPKPTSRRPERGFLGPIDLETIPLTVKDAVEATLKLGCRYLWVDRYCINQGAHAEKAEILGAMHLIYEGADATLVALYGDSDEAGLPGVSRIPRYPVDYLATDAGIFVDSCPPIFTLIRTSTWNVRGWTFQEARLSCRCIFLTKHQIYLTCQEQTKHELFASSLIAPRTYSQPTSLDINLHKVLYVSNEDQLNGHFLDRLVFSRKNLTYAHDALNAFRGILSDSGFSSFFGVPLITSEAEKWICDVTFSFGLLWVTTLPHQHPTHVEFEARKPSRRRPGFPTWSWASVAGEISNQRPYFNSAPYVFMQGPAFSSLLPGMLDGQGSRFPRYQFYDGARYISFGSWREGSLSPSEMPQFNMLPERSPAIKVRGSIVTGLQRIQVPGLFWFVGADGKVLKALTPAYISYDLDEDVEQIPQLGTYNNDLEDPPHGWVHCDALVLTECRHTERPNLSTFVLLLLKWTGEGRAERKGIVHDAGTLLPVKHVRGIPRTELSFELS